MLYDMTLVPRYVFHSSRDKNAFPLALILRFHYQSGASAMRFPLLDKIIEVEKLIGGDPSTGEEVVSFWERLLHQLQVLSQIVF